MSGMLDRLKARKLDLDSEIRSINDTAEKAGRKHLLASEERRYDALRAERATVEARIAQLEDEETRRAADAAVHMRFGTPDGSFGRGADTIYGRGSGSSYFQDLAYSAIPGDPRAYEANQRLHEHAQMIERAADDLPAEFKATRGRGLGPQQRVNPNRTDGQGGYLVPPLWIVDELVGVLRAGRSTADRCRHEDLPGGTDSINLPKLATGTSTAIQTADAQAISNTDFTDTSVSAGVKTIAGQQDISQQLLDQSPLNLDEVLFKDLIADYNQKLDLQVLNGTGLNGQMKGLLNVSGTNAITYTDASPTIPEMWPSFAQAASQVARLRFANADTIVMAPQHWYMIVAALDGQSRPLVEPSGGNGTNTVAVFDANAAEGVAGQLGGIPVVVDANMPLVNTNQLPILVGRFSDFYLYEGVLRMRAMVEPLSGTMQVRLQVFNYCALIPDRYPTALSVISGTGCVPLSGF